MIKYQDAGVSIDRGDALVNAIKKTAESTYTKGVLSGIGGFAALFELSQGLYKEPVLVSGTDGVGTKLKLALALSQHEGIGIDLVAMCANDVIVCGAKPLFFLDYYATGHLDLKIASNVIKSIAKGCQMAGVALVGGETAEMPGHYSGQDYDLAGFCVGVVEKSAIIDGKTVTPGDVLIGIGSSGPHSNGYSLIRHILDIKQIPLSSPFHGKTLGEVLLEPTRIYVKSICELIQRVPVKAIAHITGGGLLENIPRVLPQGMKPHLETELWKMPPIFDWLAKEAECDQQELMRTFNCGIGMCVCVAPEHADVTRKTLDQLGETAMVIGHVVRI
ncbi:MAG: phosphoribosylformylglycinamidine cyclo-ligase [Gammaproteobacteria bacterium]|nr:phosphoribosylformylglycinamidine cyclo-ligase [Gammaproteobacteria bacterium]